MIKVFIVDDHEIFREGIKRILNEEPDITVVGEADNGNDVLKGVQKTECDILLLDLNIPGVGGSYLIEEIIKKKPKINILVLSISPEGEFVLPLLKAGASGYVCKNSNLDELIIAIRKVFSKGRYLSAYAAEKLAFNVLAESHKLSRNLTSMEQIIMSSVVKGDETVTIADEFDVSIASVYACKRKILKKLNLKNDVELTLYAQKNNLIVN